MAANYGGHDYSFVEKNLDRFICNTICTKILKDPHLTGCCGQHFCESCLKYWFTKQSKKICPFCRAEGEEFTHILDKKLKREIDSLRVYCPNKEKGCQWVGEVESLKDHLESDNGCGYVEVECPNKCDKDVPPHMKTVMKVKRKELEIHLKDKCYRRPYQCEYCGHRDTYENITGNAGKYNLIINYHHLYCSEIPLICRKCGVTNIKRKDMEDHRSQCLMEPVQCPFAEAGCKEKLVRCELEQHISTTQQQHLLMVMGAYKEVKKANEEMKRELQKTKDEHQQQIRELSNELAHLRSKHIVTGTFITQ